MSKTAAIITLHTSPNYGSCLQAYATQEVFKSLNWDPIIIDYWRSNNLPAIKTELTLKTLMGGKLEIVLKKIPSLRRRLKKRVLDNIEKIDAPFEKFRKRYLLLTEKQYKSFEELKEGYPLADVYCTGSDQVWNNIWNGGFDKAMFLGFVPEKVPCIAYASSIGREAIDNSEEGRMKAALSKYKAISMRESSGVRILESIGISNVSRVLDPTLMLTRKDWEKVATHNLDLPNNYLLIYQLNKNKHFVELAKSVASNEGLTVVTLCHNPAFQVKGTYNVVLPEVTDFLDLFLRAKYVVTDSFHGTAFASNFEIPFLVVPPERFSVRIEDYLSLVGAQSRLISLSDQLTKSEIPMIDFSNIQQRLENERRSSLEFLAKALRNSNETVATVYRS